MDSDSLNASTTPSAAAPHRIAAVRLAQNVTLRTISRRCGVAVRQLKAEESGRCDLRLSELQRWAVALDVPLVELLAEPADSLSASIAQRAQMVRLMKSVEALRAHAESASMRQIADRLRNELLEIMPELEEITAWPREPARPRGGATGRMLDYPIRLDGYETHSDSLL